MSYPWTCGTITVSLSGQPTLTQLRNCQTALELLFCFFFFIPSIMFALFLSLSPSLPRRGSDPRVSKHASSSPSPHCGTCLHFFHREKTSALSTVVDFASNCHETRCYLHFASFIVQLRYRVGRGIVHRVTLELFLWYVRFRVVCRGYEVRLPRKGSSALLGSR